MMKMLSFLKNGGRTPKVPKEILVHLEYHFKCFFEGEDEWMDPIVDIPLKKLGVNSIMAKYYDKDTILLTVGLEKVGMLIGRKGATVGALCKYLSKQVHYKVKINAVHSIKEGV